MRNFFTLIELIVVIAVLGILAAIIIPNISSFQEEANETAIQSNIRNLQTSVDMYGLENYGKAPTSDIPLEDVPQPIDFNKIYPDYSRDLPETEGVNYWVDFQGKVWASTIDSPTNVSYNPGTLEWAGIEDAAYYNIFKVVDNSATSSIKNKKTIFIKKLEDSSETVADNTLPNLKSGEQYLVSAVDSKGFESAPAGTNYTGYVEVPFVSGQSSEPKQEALVPVGSSYIFTNAGATGRYGPSQSQLDSTYNNTLLQGKVTSNSGVQLWTVPETGTYRIETYGAEGGKTNTFVAGKGAIIKGDIELTQGTQLKVLVGQKGIDSINTGGYQSAGGGGGTFVAKSDNTPIIVAGGGGGAKKYSGAAEGPGKDAQTGVNGGAGAYAGGLNGQAGDRSDNSSGGYAGGGFYGSAISNGGQSFVNGGVGGLGDYNSSGPTYATDGGFGGGGGAMHRSNQGGGGGGGYSGGGAGHDHSSGSNKVAYEGAGGGGGSYVISTATNVSKTVGHTGHGKVVITRVQ